MDEEHGEKVGPFQILLVALSVYVLIALSLESFISLAPATRYILIHVDNVVCMVFLYDFFHRLIISRNKLRFLRWGWIDLVSSIPALPAFRVGRAVRVIRVLRLLRGFRSLKTITTVLFAQRAKGTLATAVFLCVMLVVFSSVMILQVENIPEANIHSPEDAIWWSIVTVTTVGYGDKFPVSTEGRVIGVGLMLSGVGLFSVLAGAFASWFSGDRQSKQENTKMTEQLSALTEEVRLLRKEIDRIDVVDAQVFRK